ncbi:MAG TPA: serine hydrolase, partial [Pyrinomonadaceae bacterium]|nr:serine hydrolase [Pyrinomonadaceae bacterium]
MGLGYGIDGSGTRAEVEHNVPNTSQTIFESGSVAKQFVAASLVLLQQEGKLSLDVTFFVAAASSSLMAQALLFTASKAVAYFLFVARVSAVWGIASDISRNFAKNQGLLHRCLPNH